MKIFARQKFHPPPSYFCHCRKLIIGINFHPCSYCSDHHRFCVIVNTSGQKNLWDKKKSPIYNYANIIILTYFVNFLQSLTEINDHKGKLQSIQELSTHLLYLEPIFDGKPISDDLRTLSNHFQNLVMEVFSLLEAQVL